jgi:Bacterial SH3 domain
MNSGSFAFRRSLLISAFFLLCVMSAARERSSAEGSLTAELPVPYDTALQLVSDIAANGVIPGTGEFQDETQIAGAVRANSSKLLTPVEIPGATVFYKVRERTLAPRHYKNSNDQGTLVIAYTVENISEQKSRVTIESAFVPDSHHGRSTSDGSVEACEFTVMDARLKAIELGRKQAKQRELDEQQQVHIRALKIQVAASQAQADALQTEVQQLEKRSAELRKLAVVRSKSDIAKLKESPYTRSKTLKALNIGEELRVLYRTADWCRVRTTEGEVGWVYLSFLEPAP